MATLFGIISLALTVILIFLLIYLFAISLSYIKQNLIFKIHLVLRAAQRKERQAEGK